ncbi:MAG: type II secretion system protein GspC [Abyssibacter sp.]|uniref:type II secretion system protein GspC n=1 Tax=Abyssibacter sp. TaxID=2320200 RepID=UPI00321996DA
MSPTALGRYDVGLFSNPRESMDAALIKSLQRRARPAPRWIATLLAAACGLVVAKTIWLLVPQPAWQAPPVEPRPVNAQRSDEGVNLQAILNANLFGKAAPAVAEAPQQEVVDAPDTRLPLTLKGIFASELDGESRALIARGSDEEKPYAVGDTVTGGAELYEIYADRVILDRGGKLETLRLNKDEARSTATSRGGNTLANRDGDVREVAPSQSLLNIREELLRDPSRASTYLRVQPAYNAGQLRGYRIYPGRNRTLFSEAGLRPGDLVTELNGVSLDNPTRALQLLGDLSSATSLNVTILRGGQPQQLSVNLN